MPANDPTQPQEANMDASSGDSVRSGELENEASPEANRPEDGATDALSAAVDAAV